MEQKMETTIELGFKAAECLLGWSVSNDGKENRNCYST